MPFNLRTSNWMTPALIIEGAAMGAALYAPSGVVVGVVAAAIGAGYGLVSGKVAGWIGKARERQSGLVPTPELSHDLPAKVMTVGVSAAAIGILSAIGPLAAVYGLGLGAAAGMGGRVALGRMGCFREHFRSAPAHDIEQPAVVIHPMQAPVMAPELVQAHGQGQRQESQRMLQAQQLPVPSAPPVSPPPAFNPNVIPLREQASWVERQANVAPNQTIR